jgi:hypothetical protein
VKTSLLYKRKPEFVGTAGERKAACDLTIAKGVNVLLRLEYDGTNRLHVTLGIMRGCRLFDYAFVANTPTPTVYGFRGNASSQSLARLHPHS